MRNARLSLSDSSGSGAWEGYRRRGPLSVCLSPTGARLAQSSTKIAQPQPPSLSSLHLVPRANHMGTISGQRQIQFLLVALVCDIHAWWILQGADEGCSAPGTNLAFFLSLSCLGSTDMQPTMGFCTATIVKRLGETIRIAFPKILKRCQLAMGGYVACNLST